MSRSRHRRLNCLAPNSPESPLPYCSLRDNTLLMSLITIALKNLLNVSFAIISSHSVACIFIFLTLFSAKIYIFFILMRSTLSIISFMVVYLKSHHYTQSHIMLSLRNFVVLHFAQVCDLFQDNLSEGCKI